MLIRPSLTPGTPNFPAPTQPGSEIRGQSGRYLPRQDGGGGKYPQARRTRREASRVRPGAGRWHPCRCAKMLRMSWEIDMNDWERRIAQAWAEFDGYEARGEAGEGDV